MQLSCHIEDLTLSRGGRVLLHAWTYHLPAGAGVVLRGANGAGKTTLLRALAGLVRPDSGQIRFGDIAADDARAQHIHYLGHRDAVSGLRTADEELRFWAAALHGAGGDHMDAVIAQLGLAPLLPLPCRVLSAGQRRRVALARLALAPRAIWLLDEPTAPLDAATRQMFADMLRQHLATGGVALMAAHDAIDGANGHVTLGGAP